MHLNRLYYKDKTDVDKAIERIIIKFFSEFIIPIRPLLKNKLLLSKNTKGGLNADHIDKLPFWVYEENISIHNEIMEEEAEKQKKNEESESSKSNSSFNPQQYMNNMKSMSNKFKK